MTGHQPRNPLRRVDYVLWQGERWLAAVLFLFMTALMFLNVVHRVIDRQLARAEANGYGTITWEIAILVVVCIAGARTSPRKDGSRRPWALCLGVGIAAAAVCVGFVWAVMKVFPNGLVWGPFVAMCAMLWVALLGASIATYERRHLTLEMGEKIWPKKLLKYIKALSLLAAVVACVVLLLLAYKSLTAHRADWIHNPLTGHIEDTKIPRWVVFLIFPYTFIVMAARFLGQAAQSATSRAPGEEKAS